MPQPKDTTSSTGIARPAPSSRGSTATSTLLPRCLYLEITDRCNMNCPMCITRAYRAHRSGPLLGRAEIRELLLDPVSAWGGEHFVVSGGEPMLSPILKDVLRDAVDRDFNITFASNILDESLHKFDDILRIMDDSRHGFQFSFDSVAQIEMDHIRGKAVYERVVSNAQKIARLRDRHGYRTRLFAQIVLQELNVDSVFRTIDFLLENVGVDVCIVQPEVKYSNVTLRNLRNQKPLECSAEFRTKLLDTVSHLFAMASDDPRIKVEGESLANWEKFMTKPYKIEGPCNSRNMVMVGPYGDLRGCLFSPVLGNIRSVDLIKYLQSRSYWNFLKLARVCKICINGCA
jgi:MoaA/NifB/PqqE/SkfB family radical SAM enzyme